MSTSASFRPALASVLLAAAVLAAVLPAMPAGAPSAPGPDLAESGPATFPTGCDPPGEPLDPSPTFDEPARVLADARSEPEVLVRLASELEPFDPAALVVDDGTCIVFRNDGPPHTIHIQADTTGNVAVAIEERLERGETVRVMFDHEATYALHCRSHPVLMHGVLHVA